MAAMACTGHESCCHCSPAPGAPLPLQRQIRLPLFPRDGSRKHPPDVANLAAMGLTSQKNAEGRMVHPSCLRVDIVLPPWPPAQTESSIRSSSAGLRQQRICIADLELAWCFDIQADDLAVLDQHRVTVAAQAQALAIQIERQARSRGKVASPSASMRTAPADF